MKKKFILQYPNQISRDENQGLGFKKNTEWALQKKYYQGT